MENSNHNFTCHRKLFKKDDPNNAGRSQLKTKLALKKYITKINGHHQKNFHSIWNWKLIERHLHTPESDHNTFLYFSKLYTNYCHTWKINCHSILREAKHTCIAGVLTQHPHIQQCVAQTVLQTSPICLHLCANIITCKPQPASCWASLLPSLSLCHSI